MTIWDENVGGTAYEKNRKSVNISCFGSYYGYGDVYDGICTFGKNG